MATLISSTAQVDHVKANEAQSKMTNLIQVDTTNDVSLSVLKAMAAQVAQIQPVQGINGVLPMSPPRERPQRDGSA